MCIDYLLNYMVSSYNMSVSVLFVQQENMPLCIQKSVWLAETKFLSQRGIHCGRETIMCLAASGTASESDPNQ